MPPDQMPDSMPGPLPEPMAAQLPEQMISSSAIAAVVSNPRLPDNPIVACNDAFVALTGYPREEIIGRNCRFLRGNDTEPALVETLREGIRNRRPVLVEIRNYRKDGTAFRNAVMVAPMFDAAGELEYFLGSQVEVPDSGPRPAADDSTRDAARGRIAALTRRQREILLEMARGRLNKQIAHALALSERTVKMHRAAMFRALGVRTGADAIRLVVEAGY